MRLWERWLIPPSCVLTGLPGKEMDLSEHILSAWRKPQQVCPTCGEFSASSQVCGPCRLKPPAFDRLQFAFYFEKELVELIHGLKYQNQVAYSRILAELLVSHLQTDWQVEALIAVPLHPLRRRDRGYNQADLIAKRVAKHLGLLSLSHCVKRVKATQTQTDLNRKQRRQNMRQAFAVDVEALRRYSSIALIDDVVTTGATLESLALSLREAGYQGRIEAWAIAKTP